MRYGWNLVIFCSLVSEIHYRAKTGSTIMDEKRPFLGRFPKVIISSIFRALRPYFVTYFLHRLYFVPRNLAEIIYKWYILADFEEKTNYHVIITTFGRKDIFFWLWALYGRIFPGQVAKHLSPIVANPRQINVQSNEWKGRAQKKLQNLVHSIVDYIRTRNTKCIPFFTPLLSPFFLLVSCFCAVYLRKEYGG